jgi:predicted small metal-binding protein
MSLILACNDIVPGCAAQVTAESEDEVMRQAAEHAAKDHGLTKIDAATTEKIRSAIRKR